MITLSQLTTLFGWASILNIGFLFFSTTMLVLARPLVASVHSKMFDIPESELSTIYFKFLANYKVLSIIFTFTPYIALKIMAH